MGACIDMIRKLLAASVISIMAGCAGSPTPDIPDILVDYSGKWIIKWLSNNSQNSMTLAQKAGDLSGTYSNDLGESCPVTGEYRSDSRDIEIEIECPIWEIELRGFGSQNGSMITGEYSASGDATGRFVMAKEPPEQN
jgi:hypothetical protein